MSKLKPKRGQQRRDPRASVSKGASSQAPFGFKGATRHDQ